jgi:hypothetical protein
MSNVIQLHAAPTEPNEPEYYTAEQVHKLFDEFEEHIIKRFTKTIDIQDAVIRRLEGRLNAQSVWVKEFSDRVADVEHRTDAPDNTNPPTSPKEITKWQGIQVEKVKKIQCQISHELDIPAHRRKHFSEWWLKIELFYKDGSQKAINCRTESAHEFLGNRTRSKKMKHGTTWTDESRAFTADFNSYDHVGFLYQQGERLFPNQMIALTNHLDPAKDPRVILMIDGQRIDMGPFRPTKNFDPNWRITSGSYVLFASCYPPLSNPCQSHV